MKLSNKILFGFFGFIFLYMNAAFTEIRVRGTSNVVDEKNSIAETVNLDGLSYLIINDVDKEVKLRRGESPRIEVRSLAGNVLQELTYKINGDTVTLSGLDSDDSRRIVITVFVPASFKGLSVNDCVVTIAGLEQESLSLTQNSARVWMSENVIKNIQIDLSNRSYLDLSTSPLDTVSVTLDESQVLMSSSPAVLVKGVLKNHSFLRLGEASEIQLKKDVTSNLNMYQ
jgi:hypothetical protein